MATAAPDPTISVQPQSITNGPGTDVSFSVAASGPGSLSYQWLFNGTNLANSSHVSGAMAATLTISNLLFSDAGEYRVLVSNSHGSVLSSNAVLGVQRLIAWGSNPAGQTDVPPVSSNAVAIAAGHGSVVLKPDGTVFAWGHPDYSPTNIPATLADVVSIKTTGSGTLALKNDGTVVAWGDYTPPPPPGLSNVVAVAGAFTINTCLALKNDGNVVQWNGGGYVTNGVSATLSNIIGIAAGDKQLLALRSDGTVVAWGDNSYGQTNVPPGLDQVVDVGGGSYYSMALKSDGHLVGWGTEYYGIIATAAWVDGVVDMACTPTSIMVLLDDGRISGWGNNAYGQLSYPSGVNSAIAVASDYRHGLALLGGRNAPQIHQQPFGLTAVAEQSVLFKVAAVGHVPLRYQWRCNGTNIAGAISPTLLLTNMQPLRAGPYSVVVSNSYGATESSNAVLAFTPAVITNQPQSATNFSGTSALFSVAAFGPGNLIYQWMFNGANIAGATNTVLELNDVQTPHSGSYSVVIRGSYGSVTSSIATLTVLESAPLITTQPQGQTVFIGNTISMSVDVVGSLPMSYQWQLNGVNVVGATNPAIAVSGITRSQAGGYRLVVSNSFGSDQTVLAQVNVPEVITWGYGVETNVPPDLHDIWRVGAGPNASWAFQADDTVAAWGQSGGYVPTNSLPDLVKFAGGNAFNLGLRKDGKVLHWGLNIWGVGNVPPDLTNCVSIAAGVFNGLAARSDGTVAVWGYGYYGATNVPPEATNVMMVAAGPYHCYAVRSNGTLVAWGQNDQGQCNVPLGLSNVVTAVGGYIGGAALRSDGSVVGWGNWTNYLPPVITNVVGISASHYALTVLGADGTLNVLGQNGFNITNPPAGLTNVVQVGSGTYHKTVLMAEPQPVIAHQPADVVAFTGTRASFFAPALGRQPLNYQWQLNGSALPGANRSWLRFENVQPSDYGDYAVIVSNAFGVITSAVAKLVEPIPPSIVSQPTAQDMLIGSNAVFSAVVAGDEPLSYQWFFAGSPIHDGGQVIGASSPTLQLSGVQLTNAGGYSLLVSNAYGSATSSVATLTILIPPGIAQQPLSLNVLQNSNATFTVAVTGTGPITYLWYLDGAPLVEGGPFTNTLTPTLIVLGAQTNHAGQYSVVATNNYGSVTSSVANLTVWIPVSITEQPVGTLTPTGELFSLNVSAEGSGPLSYRWSRSGTPLADDGRITGSATDTLSVSNAQPSDTGNYSVVVTNLLSSATSSIANITVLVPPAVTMQPLGRSTPLGLATTFTASISGSGPLTYQWRLDGVDIPGATNTSYTIAAVSTNDLGVYQFVVTNAAGVAGSSNALLTVGPIAAWGQNSYNQCIVPPALTNVTSFGAANYYSIASLSDGTIRAWGNAGGSTNSTFTNVVAISAGQFGSVALRADGTVTGGGNVNPFAFNVFPSNAVAVAAGFYHGLALRAEGTVVAWGIQPVGGFVLEVVPPGLTKVKAIAAGNSYSMALKSDGTVFAWGAGSITNVPSGLSNVVAISAGGNHALALKSNGTVTAWGSGQGTNVPPGLSGVAAIVAGGYIDSVGGTAFAVKSNGTVVVWGSSYNGLFNIPTGLSNVVSMDGYYHALALVNDGGPQFLTQPVGGMAWSGSDWTLKSAAVGTAPLHYQWLFNGTRIDGATNASLQFPAIQAVSAGNYQVVISNSAGSVASVVVPLNVADSAPLILVSPAATNRPYVGNPFTLSSAVGGSGPITYRWQLNEVDIPDATNSDLTFNPVGWNSGGRYSFIAENSFGSVTSSVGQVFPMSVAVWGYPSANQNGLTNVPLDLSNAVAIAANTGTAAALRADGTVAIWDIKSNYVTDGISNVVEVAPMSQLTTLFLRKDATVMGLFASTGLSNALAGISNIVAIQASYSSCTLLRADGSIVRLYSSGAMIPYPQMTNVIALDSFADGFAAVRANGTVFSDVNNGALPPPNLAMDVLAIAPGSVYGAVLKRDGTIQTWGSYLTHSGQTNWPNMVAVSPNAGVRADGTVVPWAWNLNYPQLLSVPSGLANVGAVEGSVSHSMALLVDRAFPNVLVPDALDTDALVVSSRGSPQWFGQTGVSHDGISAAQSAKIGNNTSSSMRIWVEGPVMASFWWKVSSEADHDFLKFSAGGVVLTNISGESGWQYCSLVTPPGNQILQWTYDKDGSGSAGQDAAWVDQLIITPVAPSIVSQPVGTNVVGGADVNLLVSATGTPPLAYQWQKDGVSFSSVTTSSLSLTNVTRTNSGAYSVVVTNSAGSVTSSNALLVVRVPQVLAGPIWLPDGTLTINSADADGGLLAPEDLSHFEAQASSNLVNWITLPDALSLTNGMLFFQDGDAGAHPIRFYRILEH